MKALCLFFSLFLAGSASAAELHGTGLIHPSQAEKLTSYVYQDFSDAPLTKRYDLRQTPGGLPAVKDQGACGSCWSEATTGVLETVIAAKEGRKVDLSVQQLLSCNTQRYSCDGGYFIHDMQLGEGQAAAKDFPYTASDEACRDGLAGKEHIFSWAFVGTPGNMPTTNQIKQAIFQNGPVAVTVNSNSAMQNYRGGLFKGCQDGQTNHMVVLVGWDDTVPGKEHWIMRNSWGTSWGEKGYMQIPYGCSRIGEEASTVSLKDPVRPQGALSEVK